MKRAASVFACVALAACAASCGGEDPPTRVLTLGTAYDALAAVRVMPDGITPESIFGFYFRIENVLVSGGRASGSIMPDLGSNALAFDGTFDAEGNLTMPLGTAPLTATVAETIDELGGLAEDTTPEDGIADEINGYLRTRLGHEIRDGTFLAVARQGGRPDAIDETKVHVRSIDVGMVSVAGDAGAVIGYAGVEIFRYRLRDSDPDRTLGQAMGDGSFNVEVTGIREDVFLLRARVIGKASDARFFRVTE